MQHPPHHDPLELGAPVGPATVAAMIETLGERPFWANVDFEERSSSYVYLSGLLTDARGPWDDVEWADDPELAFMDYIVVRLPRDDQDVDVVRHEHGWVLTFGSERQLRYVIAVEG
jgi:hypothetical protein